MHDVSNADLMAELKDVKREQKELRTVAADHEQRIRPLENFKIAYEAAAKALEGVSKSSAAPNINKDFINVVLKFITFLTALVGLFYLIIQAYINMQH